MVLFQFAKPVGLLPIGQAIRLCRIVVHSIGNLAAPDSRLDRPGGDERGRESPQR